MGHVCAVLYALELCDVAGFLPTVLKHSLVTAVVLQVHVLYSSESAVVDLTSETISECGVEAPMSVAQIEAKRTGELRISVADALLLC